MSDRATVRALLDGDGRLVWGDELILALNARAGGALGAALAVPQIAALVEFARRLGVPVAREVAAADADADVRLWAHAEPVPEGVALAIPEWRERAPWRSLSRVPNLAKQDEHRWETDAAMRLRTLSPAFQQRYGLDVEAALAKPLTRLFRLEEGAQGEFPILSALGLRQSFQGQRATVRESAQAVELDGFVRLDSTGEFAGFEGTVRERRDEQAASVLAEAFGRRLEEALLPPLGRIIAAANAIHVQADGPLRSEYVEYAADIAGAGRHLIGLFDDLADLQAIERPDFTVAGEPVDLADVARRAAGMLGVRAADADVRIERPDAAQKLPVTAEARRVLQVLVNLIGNAVRYSPEGATVWVRCERRGGFGLATVADTGRGIAAQDHARIFDKFERVDRSEPGGNGLGLYIARRLARAMGGDVTVESAPGEGARFTFALPSAG